jgi:uncharacterized membrane protein HdeD (DUF308 family)
MSAYVVKRRQGKGTIVAGVVTIVAGLALQALSVQSFASQAPPQFGSNPGLGSSALLSEIAGLVIVSGVIITIIGTIRYAQPGGDGPAVASSAPVAHTVAAVRSHAGAVMRSVPVTTPAFCCSCGAAIVGQGRYCASCGTPTAH